MRAWGRGEGGRRRRGGPGVTVGAAAACAWLWPRCGCRDRRRGGEGEPGAAGGSPWDGSLIPLGPVQVKRAVVQVISAMAHHGYLEQPGGEAMVEYIVQQCALPPETEVRVCPGPAGGRRLGRVCGRLPSPESELGPPRCDTCFLGSQASRKRQNRCLVLPGAFELKTLVSKSKFLLEGEQDGRGRNTQA